VSILSLEHAPQRQRKRGRPRKQWKPAGRLADTVNQWCDRTGDSRATAFRKMADGRLRYVQDTPGGPRKIPHSEYTRHGYDLPAE
jgi:hypothetical protein